MSIETNETKNLSSPTTTEAVASTSLERGSPSSNPALEIEITEAPLAPIAMAPRQSWLKSPKTWLSMGSKALKCSQ